MMKTPVSKARSVEDLIEHIKRGVRLKYVFFWGHTPRIPGRIDPSCLSNWFPAAFQIDGIRYPTTEHYMMAEKARLFSDAENQAKIITAASPGKAKALGRQIRGFREKIWAQERFDIVVRGNHARL